MCAKELASDLWPTMSSRHLRFFESPDLRRSYGPLKIRDVGWIAFTTLPTARARTEAKPSFIRTLFFGFRTLFPLSSISLQKFNCLYHFHLLHLFCPDYMSSYRKTMPSFTLVLTSGHPSFRLPIIQPSSAMLPTAPDFLMVHIWPSMTRSCWF